MASVDIGVGLLGYGTVGSAVSRLLAENGDEIERATGHRIRVVRALVRDPDKERQFPAAGGVLTGDFAALRDDPEVDLVAEVMGGLDPAGAYVRELLRAGKPVVTANKQLVAREGPELFALASQSGVQLRFEASVCAAIPVVKVLRESLVAANVHRILGIVNGTTNFVLSHMERGGTYEEALAEAQALGYAEADPSDDVNGADAAAKMAILATVAFGSRVLLEDVQRTGIATVGPEHVAAAAAFGMVVRLVGIATLVDDAVDVRVQPAFVDRAHPLASVDGAFNAVMLQGDAIREITLGGPGAGGLETASAVVADLVSIVGTVGHGLPPERRVLARARAPRPGGLAFPVLRAPRRGRPPRRARPGGRDARSARRLRRAARPALARRPRSARPRAARRAASAPSTAATRRARGAARGARAHRSSHPVVDRGRRERGHARRRRDAAACAPRLSERFGVELWLKWEGANPTGSFKDRGMAVAVTRAVERGSTRIVCASTGNTAASCAAYAARAGIEAVIVVPAGGAASSKLVQVRAVGGAHRRGCRTRSRTRTARPRSSHAEPGSLLVNSTNPDRIEGQMTAAAEIVEQLGRVPDVLTLPYGGGGTRRRTRAASRPRRAPSRGSIRSSRRRAPTRSPRPSASSSRSTTPRSPTRSSVPAAR